MRVKEISLKETMGRIESDVIRRALNEVNGNVSMCARLLKDAKNYSDRAHEKARFGIRKSLSRF